jgi:hypothetical protein
VRRGSHGAFDLSPDRPDPTGLLEGQEKSEVPALAPVRYGQRWQHRSPAFRGAALPMASDLALTPVSGLAVQAACGDAQLSNFGVFGSAECRLVFDVNMPAGLRIYGALRMTLARAHACSGDRIAIAAYLGTSATFDQAITRFAAAYEDQNERDYQALVEATASRRISVERGQ